MENSINNTSNSVEATEIDPVQKAFQNAIEGVSFTFALIKSNQEGVEIPENEEKINCDSLLKHLALAHVLLHDALKSYFKHLEENGND